MDVELIESMGTDLSVVNAARVSYRKAHTKFTDGDRNLLRFLKDNDHWSPFAHPTISFTITSSIAVARQLMRHQVGLAVNEVSRRYVDDEPIMDWPVEWRGRPDKGQSKQGSSGPLSTDTQDIVDDYVEEVTKVTTKAYNALLVLGVAPEQARLVLPLALETSWRWTGSLYAFIRICRERLAPDAQVETRDVVKKICSHMFDLFPETMAIWEMTDA